MLPDMSGALEAWKQPVKIKTATTTTVDFVKSVSISETTINAVVQPADKEKLNPDTVDWSLEYIMVHSVENIEIGQFIEWQSKDYKIIQLANTSQYGFDEAIGEEVKGAIS